MNDNKKGLAVRKLAEKPQIQIRSLSVSLRKEKVNLHVARKAIAHFPVAEKRSHRVEPLDDGVLLPEE